MRALALVALLATGCSWTIAERKNDPRIGCTRANAWIDASFAMVGVANMGLAVWAAATDDNIHTDLSKVWGLWFLAGFVLAAVDGLQARYGFDVADRCEAERARMTDHVHPPS